MRSDQAPEYSPHAFFNHSWTQWNVEDFASYFMETPSDQNKTFQLLASTYTNSLNSIHRDPANSHGRREKAHYLRQKWDARPRVEHQRAKQCFLDFISPKPGLPGVVIHGNVGGDVSIIGDVTSNHYGEASSEDSIPRKRRKRHQGSVLGSSASEDDDKQGRKQRKKKKKKKKSAGSKPITDPGLFLVHFKAAYQRMTPKKKWILSTGRVVEDVIYFAALSLPKETIAHSFIINPTDSWFENLFQAEWPEILSYLEDRRKMSLVVSIPESLDRIPDMVTTTGQLRNILYHTAPPQGSDEEWVDAVYRQFLFLMEHPDKPLSRDNCENWLEVMVWSTVINRGLMCADGLQIQCKEVASISTRRHNNQGRTETGEGHYLLPSPRLDAIYRLLEPDFEFGGCEVGKSDKGPEDTKRLEDFKKLLLTLCHMLLRLHNEFNLDPEKAKDLEVIGLMCSGLTVQSFRMHCPSKYVCLVVQDPTLRLPANALRLRDIRPVLHRLWRVKKTISDSMALVLGSDAKMM